jgi:hypothetical protein
MPWPFEEQTLFENILGIVLLYLSILLVYFVFRPILFKFQERRSGPIEEGTDAPDEEYWRDD